MKRPLSESRAMDRAILELFKEHPEAQMVENRYRTLRKLIVDRFPAFKDIDKELMYKALFDIVTLDRKVRKLTEGMQNELKQELSEEYQIEELGYGN